MAHNFTYPHFSLPTTLAKGVRIIEGPLYVHWDRQGGGGGGGGGTVGSQGAGQKLFRGGKYNTLQVQLKSIAPDHCTLSHKQHSLHIVEVDDRVRRLQETPNDPVQMSSLRGQGNKAI